MNATKFTFTTTWLENQRLTDYLKGKKKTVLIFMRFYGCRLCQIDIDRIIENYEYIEKHNSQVLIVLQTEPHIIREQREEIDTPITLICDPDHQLYKLYNVGIHNLKDRPDAVTEKLNMAIKLGYKKVENNQKEIAKQLPATFIINNEARITFSYYGIHTGDTLDIKEILKELNCDKNQ